MPLSVVPAAPARRGPSARRVPGVVRRFRKFEARVPSGSAADGWVYLGLFPTEALAEAAVVAERRRRRMPLRTIGPLKCA